MNGPKINRDRMRSQWNRSVLFNQRRFRSVAIVILAAALIKIAYAQTDETFKTRLSTVPIDIPMQAMVAGSGTASATLTGTKLTVSGTFTGMRSPAVAAHVYLSVTPGVPGARLFDLTVTDGASGSFKGSSTLSMYQVDDLRLGRLYVQIHSRGAPDGNLRGWLIRDQ
jgi:hypothetical protein